MIKLHQAAFCDESTGGVTSDRLPSVDADPLGVMSSASCACWMHHYSLEVARS